LADWITKDDKEEKKKDFIKEKLHLFYSQKDI
jgi:hypothetical protein